MIVHRGADVARRGSSRLVPILLVFAAILVPGCSSSEKTVTRFPTKSDGSGGTSAPASRPSEPMKEVSPREEFGYLVENDACNCPEYSISDNGASVDYRFSAFYRMQDGIVTSIKIGFDNRSSDTLFLDRGSVKVASRNVEYQYNNRFVPLPDMLVPPGNSEELNLDGKEVTSAPSWRKIAGEKLTLTLRGLRLGSRTLGNKVVTFVPENPMLGNQEPD